MRKLLESLATLSLTMQLAVSSAADSQNTEKLSRLEPQDGACYAGANINFGEMPPEKFNEITGFKHAIFVDFFNFPIKDMERVRSFIERCKKNNAIALVTLEPFDGLEKLGKNDFAGFADLCAKSNSPVLVRFAHEMNGSWYPWGQRPALHIEKFRMLADNLHSTAPNAATLWAPNNGAGYPYGGGKWEAKPGSEDFKFLDTNNDGKLSEADDMYSPYYPGDDAVDWVGMTIYHWGNEYPWGENEPVKARKFSSTLTGNRYPGDPVPDFYSMFCSDTVHHKPMAIPETSALFNTERNDGAGEIEIKEAWIKQVYHVGDDTMDALAIDHHFPKLKAINWFNHKKSENEIKAVADWTITSNPAILESYRKALKAKRKNGTGYYKGCDTSK